MTHCRGLREKRGRKPKLTRTHVRKLDAARKRLIKEANGEHEVTWSQILRSARTPKIARSNILNAFRRCGVNVTARRPREKPQRDESHAAQRVHICRSLLRKPINYLTDQVDLMIDNKRFDVPTSCRAKRRMKQGRVRYHIRTRAEGVAAGFTKPGRKKNRYNTGGSVNVCAGICNGKVVLWEYLSTWNGKAAADLYRGPIKRTLRTHRGVKSKYLILEDNDPSGYKSRKAVDMKQALNIHCVQWPKYSPDLHPLDFSLWSEIERRVLRNKPTGGESVTAYRKRLRMTALRLPKTIVTAAVASMRARIKQVILAKGLDGKRD